jgi:hypothetical protein
MTQTNRFTMFDNCGVSLAVTLVAALASHSAPRDIDPGREGFGILEGVFPMDGSAEFWIACAQALQSRGILAYSPATRCRIIPDACMAVAKMTLFNVAQKAEFAPVPDASNTMAIKTLLARFSRECRAEFEDWQAEQARLQADADALAVEFGFTPEPAL